MKIFKTVFIMFSVFITLNSQAGWWIFGNSKADIDYKYLTFNGVNWDELDSNFKIYPDMLPNGITIEGQALVSKGKVGSVRISVKKDQWKIAEVEDDGTFKLHFNTFASSKYELKVEISDTAGKKNDVESTKKIIEITQVKAKEAISRILKSINNQYKGQNIDGVMKDVSKQFLGDKLMLEDAIRSDFTLFNSSKIDLTPVAYNFNDDLRVVVDVKYIRTLMSKTTNKLLSDRGFTRFVFKLGANDLELYSMQFPILFGLSDAANIATGFARPGGNPNTIVVDDGDSKIVPFDSALVLVGSGASVISGIVRVTSSNSGIDTLSFGSESVSREAHSDFPTTAITTSNIQTGDIAVTHTAFRAKTGTMIKALTGTDLNSFSEVPTTGYVTATGQSKTGNVFAVKTALGKYAIIAISGFSLKFGITSYTITYKYQTNGTNKF